MPAADSAPPGDSQQQLSDSQPLDSQPIDSQDMLMANQADDCEGMAGEAREGEGGEEEDTTDDEFVDPIVSHELAEELQAQSDHEAEEILELLKDSPTEPDSHKPEPVQQKETQATAEASHAQQAASKAAASNESGEAPVAGGPPLSPVGVEVPDSDEEKNQKSKRDSKDGKVNVGRFKD